MQMGKKFVSNFTDIGTLYLHGPAESTPESFPMKIWPVKPLFAEKSLNFLPSRFMLQNLVCTNVNIK